MARQRLREAKEEGTCSMGIKFQFCKIKMFQILAEQQGEYIRILIKPHICEMAKMIHFMHFNK